MSFSHSIRNINYVFADLKTLLAKASPARSGDYLAGVAATSAQERVAAQMALADVPLKHFLNEALIPYEIDEVTRLIFDTHNPIAFQEISGLTVGDFRNYLLSENLTTQDLSKLQTGLTPEMVAAVSKIMRIQDMITLSAKCQNISKFRNTIGSQKRLSTRLQPNHPTDNYKGIAASVLDGLMYGSGDACIGINPATDSLPTTVGLLKMLDQIIQR